MLCCAHRQRLAPGAHPQNVLCCLESVACPIRAGGCFVCAGGSRGQHAQLLRRFCALCASVAGLLRCFRSKMSKSPLGVLNIFVRNLHPTRANPLKIEQVRTAYIFVHRQKALPAAKPFSKFPETAKQRAQPSPRPSPPPRVTCTAVQAAATTPDLLRRAAAARAPWRARRLPSGDPRSQSGFPCILRKACRPRSA